MFLTARLFAPVALRPSTVARPRAFVAAIQRSMSSDKQPQGMATEGVPQGPEIKDKAQVGGRGRGKVGRIRVDARGRKSIGA